MNPRDEIGFGALREKITESTNALREFRAVLSLSGSRKKEENLKKGGGITHKNLKESRTSRPVSRRATLERPTSSCTQKGGCRKEDR